MFFIPFWGLVNFDANFKISKDFIANFFFLKKMHEGLKSKNFEKKYIKRVKMLYFILF